MNSELNGRDAISFCYLFKYLSTFTVVTWYSVKLDRIRLVVFHFKDPKELVNCCFMKQTFIAHHKLILLLSVMAMFLCFL